MSGFLCYDLRGIQSYIFQVPRLRYIVGGSAVIDRFDRDTVPTMADDVNGITHLFSAGGKGSFSYVSDEACSCIQDKLKSEAHAFALDIRFGVHEKFSEAATNASQLFPYMPDESKLSGHPCPVSGLYPVDGEKEHRSVRVRCCKDLRNRYEKELIEGIVVPTLSSDIQPAFFRNVNSGDGNTPQEKAESRAGSAALGGRNRWAVICMDGNDMGAQFGAAVKEYNDNEDDLLEWIKSVGIALDECTRGACRDALQYVVKKWAQDTRNTERATIKNGSAVILPVRPLLVGGDDISVLCHSSYAMDFVREVVRSFTERSKKDAHLWLGTDGELTISAGVTYCSTSLPLASAIDYSEQLLAQAKTKGRTHQSPGKAAPAAVDWDTITESIITTPRVRRQAEFCFVDGDAAEDRAEICLTRRPYLISEMGALDALCAQYLKIPNTIRHHILPNMRAAQWDRSLYLEQMRKHQPALVKHLDVCDTNSRWKNEDGVQSIDVIDALLLLEESGRMTQEDEA